MSLLSLNNVFQNTNKPLLSYSKSLNSLEETINKSDIINHDKELKKIEILFKKIEDDN